MHCAIYYALRMRSFNMSGPFEWRINDGRDEYGEKAMEVDEGSSESSSLLTESQSINKYYDVKQRQI